MRSFACCTSAFYVRARVCSVFALFLLPVCWGEHAYLVRRLAGGKRLTFPHSCDRPGHAPG